MRRSFSFLLVWVMVLAVPAQGMAAALMVFCETAHERSLQVAAPCEQAQAQAHALAHAHAHSHADFEAPAVHAALQAEPAEGSEPSCSACAICCLMLAIPVGRAAQGSLAPQHWIVASVDSPTASHLPDGLERPPRDLAA